MKVRSRVGDRRRETHDGREDNARAGQDWQALNHYGAIENPHFHVKDASMRENREVKGHHHTAAVLSHTSLSPLGGVCQL